MRWPVLALSVLIGCMQGGAERVANDAGVDPDAARGSEVDVEALDAPAEGAHAADRIADVGGDAPADAFVDAACIFPASNYGQSGSV
jgi:hypothetical protein